ncbi:MAG: SusD/RagB family nutrient-binding outer membrane lipoprotein [Chitinophagaceae bacterium]|nr:SusD/RagB family nutrient-binding outer membrane lipoprotein [Chitinophagaceae bacterium]MCW5928878.1 SusD/RagB family nutrient-binding outer membrane lipoprotein [Chitinophagaceae bacterium]
MLTILFRTRIKIIYAAVFYILGMTILTGCTKRFEEINTDPTTLSELTPATIPLAFSRAQYQGLYSDAGIYQLARTLFADYWSQYYATVSPGQSTDRFVLREDWTFYQWSSLYSVSWPTLKLVLEATENTDPAAHAMAKIWKVYIFHSHTDFFGPVPYFEAGKGLLKIPYDSQEAVYNDLFILLEEAVNTLKNADPSSRPYGNSDLIFHGDISKWIKLGNTLRLRLALRISAVQPDKARLEAEKAVASGVMITNDDDAFMDVNATSHNGLAIMSPWGNFRMSATIFSYLKGYNDPRLQEYFSPAVNTGEYASLRNGLTSAQLTASPMNQGNNLSNIGPRYHVDKGAETKLTVMYAAEAWLLRAEGALNGWNMGGDAKELYEEGIATSLHQWGITGSTINDYIQGTSMPAPPEDYLNSPPVADIPVLFSSDPEKQRQQILTQKWLALFPDGIEAWTEVRRTGYPVLYPVVQSDNPQVPSGSIVKRFVFLAQEYQSNGEAVQAALPLLDGPDSPATPLWWNK